MKNRKRADTYRFNGHPFFNAKSIFSVETEKLEERIKRLEAKLADPNDLDDPRWTQYWLERYQQELKKKQKGKAFKEKERQKGHKKGL